MDYEVIERLMKEKGVKASEVANDRCGTNVVQNEKRRLCKTVFFREAF